MMRSAFFRRQRKESMADRSRRPSISSIIAGAATVILVAAIPVAQASAGRSGPVVQLPDGTSVVLPTGNPSLSDLARLGIAPGQHGIVSATTTVSASPIQAPSKAASVSPDTALGKCNLAVCEDVYGTGLIVVEWDSYTTEIYDTCTYAVFWEPQNTIFALGNEVCGEGYFSGQVLTGLPHTFGNGSYACASYALIAGKPCATIHS